MEIGPYKLESIKKFEDAVSAAFVRKGDVLAVAIEQPSEYTVELLDLRKLKPLGRATVQRLHSLKRVGEEGVLVIRLRDFKAQGEAKYKQTFEVCRLKDFGVTASFVEEKPGHVAAHPDGTQVAVAHDFGPLKVWDARSGELLSEFASKGVGGVAYSDDGRLLAAKEFAGSLRIFDAARPGGKPLRSVAVGGKGTEIAFRPGSHLLAVAGRGSITLVDADTGDKAASIGFTKREHLGAVGRMAFSADGRLIVTATLDHEGAVGLWDAQEAEFLGHLTELGQLASGVEFDAKGEHLLVASYNYADLYSVKAT